MTIRARLTLQFIILTGILLAAVLGTVLMFFSGFLEQEFRSRLRDRAEIAMYLFVRDDELSDRAEARLRRRYLEKLTDEVLQIYDARLQARFIRKDYRVQLSQQILSRIVNEREVYFRLGERQAVGLYLNEDEGQFVVVAAAQDHFRAGRIRQLALLMGVAFVISLGVLAALGRWFAQRALAPISALNDEADRITARELYRRVSEGNGQDELARLAQTFNRLLSRLEDSFAAQRALVANASHELRTPLTATIGELQVLLTRARSVEEYRTALSSVLDELLRLKHLNNDLLDLAQATGGSTMGSEELRLDEVVEDAVRAVRTSWPEARLRLNFDYLPTDPEALVRQGNRRLLTRALVNLLENACKYSNEHPVDVALGEQDHAAVLSIRDRGIGIAPDEQNLVFEPFYRAANARQRQGHGLGLALARSILAQHSAHMALTSAPGEGTEVVVTFG